MWYLTVVKSEGQAASRPFHSLQQTNICATV